jgi:hypothetical protein
MRNGMIVAPALDLGRVAVDQPLDATLDLVWQRPLAGHTPDTRLASVAGAAVLLSPVHGVVALGADPPDLAPAQDRGQILTHAGSAYPGQLLVTDGPGTVYRLTPGQAPRPVWRNPRAWEAFDGLDGLPGGLLLAVTIGDDWSSTQLIEEATGKVRWRSSEALSTEMLVGNLLVGSARSDLVALDVRTGQEQWRRRRVSPVLGMVGMVDGLVWIIDSMTKRLTAFRADSGHTAASITLPRETRMAAVLDQAGRLHLGDENGWIVVDLRQARVISDVHFVSPPGAPRIHTVYANRTRRSADGRLIVADDQGQIFVAHPERPDRPRRVAELPAIRGIEIAAGRLIVLSHDGTLTAIGAPGS